jgi:hypothetical protein
MQLTRYLTRRAVGWLALVSALSLNNCSSNDAADESKSANSNEESAPFIDEASDNAATTDRNGGDNPAQDVLNDCAGVSVTPSRIRPRIVFVIDRSGSMSEAFRGSTSRWDAVRTALMDRKNGVIAGLQSVAYFGMVVYDGPLPQPWGPGGCPNLVVVDPELNNFTALERAFPSESPMPLSSSTPTAAALNEAYRRIADIRTELGLDNDSDPSYVVLCTDGQPNQCINSDLDFAQFSYNSSGGIDFLPDYQAPVESVTDGSNLGIGTFVVSLDSGTQQFQQHLEQLAQIGGTGLPVYTPATQDELTARLSLIVDSALGCKVKLNKKVDLEQECTGRVELNGRELKCGEPDGWVLADESHIELLGQACHSFIKNPTAILHISFPCQAFAID